VYESYGATRKRSAGALGGYGGSGVSQQHTHAPEAYTRAREAGREGHVPTVAVTLEPRRVQARVACTLGFDGFDHSRDQVLGNVGTGDPLANERFTLVLGLNANVHKAGVCQHPCQVVQE
jgi:hypothetical protein